ncbi:MAG: hypothetical protein WBQ53_03425 [Methylocystis sp.]
MTAVLQSTRYRFNLFSRAPFVLGRAGGFSLLIHDLRLGDLSPFHGDDGRLGSRFFLAALFFFLFHNENRVDERRLFGALLFFFLFLAPLLLFLFKSDERVANKCLFCPLLFLPFMPASIFLPLFHGGEGPVAEKHPFGALVFLPLFESGDDSFAERYLVHVPLPFFGFYPTSAGRMALLRVRLLLTTNFGKRHRPLDCRPAIVGWAMFISWFRETAPRRPNALGGGRTAARAWEASPTSRNILF